MDPTTRKITFKLDFVVPEKSVPLILSSPDIEDMLLTAAVKAMHKELKRLEHNLDPNGAHHGKSTGYYLYKCDCTRCVNFRPGLNLYYNHKEAE